MVASHNGNIPIVRSLLNAGQCASKNGCLHAISISLNCISFREILQYSFNRTCLSLHYVIFWWLIPELTFRWILDLAQSLFSVVTH